MQNKNGPYAQEEQWALETLMTKGEQPNRNHKPHYIRKRKIKM